MKILRDSDILLFIVLLLMAACAIIGGINTFVHNKGIPPEQKRLETMDASTFCDYVKFDGHEYVRYIDFYRAGLAHSPKCWCMTNLTEKIKQ